VTGLGGRLVTALVAMAVAATLPSAGPGAPRFLGPPRAAAAEVPAEIDPALLRPEIVWKPIPYGSKRKRQMARYSRRHYGVRSWRLVDPPVIVQHYTAGLSWRSAWNHFASNDPWNGERPGTCTHFIIDRDGTIYQLVRLHVRCRHVVGLNHVAIGIEHVGTSDRMVLDDPQQMRSSLALTVWLQARFGIAIGDVIGHAEALEHRLHHELVESWRCLVHADFPHRAMREYRDRLREALTAAGVPVGHGVDWRPSGC
jgi:N-acetylmuramoyl-L-alanine amidase